MMVLVILLVILLGVLVIALGVIVFLQSNTIDSLMDLRKLENDEYAEELMSDAEFIARLKQQLDAAQNAYLTLGRYIFENKERLNDEED